MSVAVLFPGQGSQYVGMGEELFERRPDLLGESADEVLGWSLRDICLEGPEEKLTRTEFAQPALFALAYALYSEAERAGLVPDGAAGHSLGEYTALAAAEALGFKDALRVVAARGRAMASAADLEPSGMAALIGADEAKADEVAKANNSEGGRLQVANLNAPGQVVVAGSVADIDWLQAHARDHGIRRAIPLKVAGAFHSSFMQSASDEVRTALAGVDFTDTTFPVWANTTASPHVAGDIATQLSQQVVSPVRFEASVRDMLASGFTHFIHVGPGDVTAGMARRIVDGDAVYAISSLEDVGPVLDSVGTIA